MPWWSWVVIWAALALALVGMLAVMAVRLFRKGLGVLAELDTLGSKLELLESEAEELSGARRQLAILLGTAEVRERRAAVREAALARKAVRHAARIARGRALTAVDANTREWFKAP